MFTWTVFDRLKYGLSRLTFGMATWRGLDAQKLAAETAASGKTAAVVACRFPPGFGGGPHAANEWRQVAVTFAHTDIEFGVGANRKPSVVEVSEGTHRLRVAHNGPPPYFETTVDVSAGQTVLIEVQPASKRAWFRPRPARLLVKSGNDESVAEHDL